jgi:nucleotide-binding universal stress UspA family protein
MAKRMLVPLDRTAHAEAVLPLVADLARGAGATVRLLHVAPAPDNVVDADGRLVAYADQEMARLEAEALDYLHTVTPQLSGTEVECVVRFGDAIEEIVREAEAFAADLIAFTTSIRSSVRQLLVGTTADRVSGRAAATVVVVRPAA